MRTFETDDALNRKQFSDFLFHLIEHRSEYKRDNQFQNYTPAVEDAVAHTMQQRSELDWLIDNAPPAYVGLVMSGKSEEYLKAVTR